jgi:predicted ester cyclase
MSHYAPEVVLISPIAARLLNDSSGTVVGKEALLSYFRRGLQAYPNLAFTLIEVMWGVSSIVLHYVNQNNTKCGEFMELAPDGKVVRVVAHYSS